MNFRYPLSDLTLELVIVFGIAFTLFSVIGMALWCNWEKEV